MTRSHAFRGAVRATIIAIGLAAVSAFAAPTFRHTALKKSEPAANDTLAAAPRTVKLWFTEKVELGVTRVKLADAAGEAIALSPVVRPDTAEDAPVVTTITGALKPGGYVLHWSTAAKDGHPAKGSFAFVVRKGR